MYVHSLVMIAAEYEVGWYAPVEVGEAASHAIGFVIPVGKRGQLKDSYACETIKALGSDKQATIKHTLEKVGTDSFRLCIYDEDIWFTIRPSMKKHRLLRYLGKLKHPDFERLLVEIEPREQNALDRLYEVTGEFIIGCDPYRHYKGISRLTEKVRTK